MQSEIVFKEVGWLQGLKMVLFQLFLAFLVSKIIGFNSVVTLLFAVVSSFLFGKIIGAKDMDEDSLRRLALYTTVLHASLVLLLTVMGLPIGFSSPGGTAIVFAFAGIIGVEGVLHYILVRLGLKFASELTSSKW